MRGESLAGQIVVARRDELLTMAALPIAPLQDAVDLEVATPEYPEAVPN